MCTTFDLLSRRQGYRSVPVQAGQHFHRCGDGMRKISFCLLLVIMTCVACSRSKPPFTNQEPPIKPTNGTLAILDSTLDYDIAPTQTEGNETIATSTLELKGGDMPTSPQDDRLTITILYDNYAHDSRLQTAWGFSALIEYKDDVLLFDTGGDSPTLLKNMEILEIDPGAIDAIIISHEHGDHTGGLEGLLAKGIQPTVYAISTLPAGLKQRVSQLTTLVEDDQAQEIVEGIHTTGKMNGMPPEQALIIRSSSGLVIITGCAHPGIVQIIEEARRLHPEPVHLVLGGFHLRDKSSAQIQTILSAFRRLDVERVAPTHCTGDLAIRLFADEYEGDYLPAGVGRIFILEP
jgi:7,8-dihydropterin-6-yl-methyl-4-(beta-D-ribofuranosyl)aminobenzene 5'-phosphate synthase